jgi:hypothetical protein
MEKLSTTGSFPRVIRQSDCNAFEVLGAGVQFVVGPLPGDETRAYSKERSLPVLPYPCTVTMWSKISLLFMGILKCLWKRPESCIGSKPVRETSSKFPATVSMRLGTDRSIRRLPCSLPPPGTVVIARNRPIRCLWRKRRTAGRNAAFSEDGEALWLLVCDSGRERSRWY